jgi:hypothetical protein
MDNKCKSFFWKPFRLIFTYQFCASTMFTFWAFRYKGHYSAIYINLKKRMNTIQILIATILFLMVSVNCSSSEDEIIDDIPKVPSMITGSVKDENGNGYPNTLVKINKAIEVHEVTTDSQGKFEINTKDIGIYISTFVLPLSTKEITNLPVMLNVEADQGATLDFVIQTQALEADLVIEKADIFDEIKDKDGNDATSSGEPLYAKNVFDPPLGKLTAIKAPDGHQVTLSEWEKAEGKVRVSCNGDMATAEIALQGMIPNGTYTFWLNFLNKAKSVGQSVDFNNDLVSILPLGSGTENIAIAEADGTINTTIQHNSCILTKETALVLVIVYHINGNTFGADHIPDEEEVNHMLVYFQ